MYSNSNLPQLVSWLLVHISQLSFPLRPRSYTHKLAHASDSLVRVSRRVKWIKQLKQPPCTPTCILRGRCANWQRQQVECQGMAIGIQAMLNVICMPWWQCNLVAATQQDTQHTHITFMTRFMAEGQRTIIWLPQKQNKPAVVVQSFCARTCHV